MKNITIHVGMPKTASSFLQRRFYPTLEDTFDCYNDSPEMVSLLLEMAETPSLFFDVKRAKERVEDILSGVREKNIIISHEEIFGDLLNSFYNNADSTRNLHAVFGKKKILLIIRRQDTLIESIYKQALQSYFYPTVRGFLNYRKGQFGGRNIHAINPNIDVRLFDLRAYVQNYMDTFGAENVLVLPYEMIRKDMSAYLETIAGFVGAQPERHLPASHENRSYSITSCYIALLLNRFVGTFRNILGIIPDAPLDDKFCGHDKGKFYRFMAGITRRISLRYLLQEVLDRAFYIKGNMINDALRKKIMDMHSESNQQLDKDLGLDLKEYGYY